VQADVHWQAARRALIPSAEAVVRSGALAVCTAERNGPPGVGVPNTLGAETRTLASTFATNAERDFHTALAQLFTGIASSLGLGAAATEHVREMLACSCGVYSAKALENM
jgi:hypothetical protein